MNMIIPRASYGDESIIITPNDVKSIKAINRNFMRRILFLISVSSMSVYEILTLAITGMP